jgi:SSS family solute:Na+ symporter
MGYIAMTAFALNLAVAALVTVALNALKVSNGRDSTSPGDYYADTDDPRVQADLAVKDDLTRGEPGSRRA